MNDLQFLLERSPIASHHSDAVECAVEEFARLRNRSAALSRADYCRRIAAFDSQLASSVFRQLEVEDFLQGDPNFQESIASRPWPTPGERQGSYQFVEELGRGALARVYLCRELDMGGRNVVVKVGRRIRLEYCTLGRLSHPNIVPIYRAASIDPDGTNMLCMPFLGRSTLLDLIALAFSPGASPSANSRFEAARASERPTDRICSLPPASKRHFSSYEESVVDIGVRLADAISYAHSRGIFHGDIKPSNVLLTANGEPLLLDFNLSGSFDLSEGVVGGTLPYMAPEQIKAAIVEQESLSWFDHRSDIFSFGVVMYELLTGAAPFSYEPCGNERLEIANALLGALRKGPVPVNALNNAVTPSLQRLIESCLSWNVNDRPSSMSQVQDTLRDELTKFSVIGRLSQAACRVGRIVRGRT